MDTAKELDDRFRKYAWDYFSVHASQRLMGVQFFITLATAIIGGYFALVAGGGGKWIGVLGLLLTLLSFVFFKLDERTRDLIKNAENALLYLDGLHHTPDPSGEPHPLQLIARDNYLCSRAAGRVFGKRLSYTKCFNIVFVGFGILGLAAFIHAFFYMSDKPKDEHKSVLIIQVDAPKVGITSSATGGAHVQQ